MALKISEFLLPTMADVSRKVEYARPPSSGIWYYGALWYYVMAYGERIQSAKHNMCANLGKNSEYCFDLKQPVS